jgi:hypothetical protein
LAQIKQTSCTLQHATVYAEFVLKTIYYYNAKMFILFCRPKADEIFEIPALGAAGYQTEARARGSVPL